MNNVDQLIKDHKKLIEAQVRKYSSFIPMHVVEVEAYKLAKDAAKEYDPKAGVKFSTYLVSKLKKLQRISTQYGNIARVPEDKQYKIHRLTTTEENLRNEFGRDPTLQELSDATGYSIGVINNLKTYRKKDVNVSALSYSPIFIAGDNDDWVHFVYHDLDTRDKFIFEHKTGFNGAKVLSNEQIAKQLKMSPSTVSNRVKIITDRLQEGWS